VTPNKSHKRLRYAANMLWPVLGWISFANSLRDNGFPYVILWGILAILFTVAWIINSLERLVDIGAKRMWMSLPLILWTLVIWAVVTKRPFVMYPAVTLAAIFQAIITLLPSGSLSSKEAQMVGQGAPDSMTSPSSTDCGPDSSAGGHV